MSQSVLTVTVNDQSYEIACAPGQEETLGRLAGTLDERVRKVAATGEALGDRQLLVMVGLMLIHEVAEAETRAGSAEAEAEGLAEYIRSLSGRIDAAARRIDAA